MQLKLFRIFYWSLWYIFYKKIFVEKIWKIRLKMVKNRKKSVFRKNLFFLRTTAPFFIRRDLQLEPKITFIAGEKWKLWSFLYWQIGEKSKKSSFSKKSILFIDNRGHFYSLFWKSSPRSTIRAQDRLHSRWEMEVLDILILAILDFYGQNIYCHLIGQFYNQSEIRIWMLDRVFDSDQDNRKNISFSSTYGHFLSHLNLEFWFGTMPKVTKNTITPISHLLWRWSWALIVALGELFQNNE